MICIDFEKRTINVTPAEIASARIVECEAIIRDVAGRGQDTGVFQSYLEEAKRLALRYKADPQFTQWLRDNPRVAGIIARKPMGRPEVSF
jgi:hypothetical protein